MNITRVVIGRCPWSIRVQAHGGRHGKRVSFFGWKWRAVLKMFARLFGLNSDKAREVCEKRLAGAVYREEKWKRRNKKSSWRLKIDWSLPIWQSHGWSHGNLLYLFYTWRAILKMFARLLRIKQVKTSKKISSTCFQVRITERTRQKEFLTTW